MESIEELLQTTGWSCDDLLAKLQQYKSKQVTNAPEANTDESLPSTSQQLQVESTNVILDSYPTNCQKEDTLKENSENDISIKEFTCINSSREETLCLKNVDTYTEILNTNSLNEKETSLVNVEKNNDFENVTSSTCEKKSNLNKESGSIDDSIMIAAVHSLEQQSTTSQENKENTFTNKKQTLAKDSFQKTNLGTDNGRSILERNNDENRSDVLNCNSEKNEISVNNKVLESFDGDETVHKKEIPSSSCNSEVLIVNVDDSLPVETVNVECGKEKDTDSTQEISSSSNGNEISATFNGHEISAISNGQEIPSGGRLMIFKKKTEKLTNLFTLRKREDAQVAEVPEGSETTKEKSVTELETSSAQGVDDLRNILKMQLSSLRNKKRSDEHLSDFQKKTSVLFENLKKKRKPVNVIDRPFAHLHNEVIESGDNQVRDSLISLTDETQFLIVNVTGGVDRVEDNSDTKPEGEATNPRRFASISNETSEDSTKTIDMEKFRANSDTSFSKIKLNYKRKLLQEEEPQSNYIKEKRIGRKKVLYGKRPMTSFLAKSLLVNETPSGSSTQVVEAGESDFGEKTEKPVDGDESKRYELINNYLNNPSSPLIKKIQIKQFNRELGTALTSEAETSPPKPTKKKLDKSPFVSDSLEDFLTESAQLKISYAIPKLGAEEGLIEKPKESPYLYVTQTPNKSFFKEEATNESSSGKKVIKAKTLAEKRRQFEKLQRKMEKLEAKSSKIKQHDPIKTNPTEISIEDMVKAKWSDMNPEGQNKPFVSLQRDSYVLWNNRRLWLPARNKSKCLGKIKVNRKEHLSPKSRSEQKKLSLLSTLAKNRKTVKVKYKPGPLCKKEHLQCSDSSRLWKTELKTLPQVYLEVVPQINRPIDPKILHLLPVFNDVLVSKERVDFSLSVLKTNLEEKPFKFPVRYKNDQEQFLVRRRHKRVQGVKLFDNEVASDPETCIKSIINDLITYVEIKETADTIIKEDDRLLENDKKLESVDEKKEKTSKGIRIGRKRKLDLELQRLSCKVINVETEVPDDRDCSKPYCRMGCVCKSLACESVFSNHCQLVECMFECKCPTSRTEETLSEYTVNHLDDQAKRNLAKVEREFTQTIIHAGNDTIVVGSGGRNKVRRASKAPKKYSDYVEDINKVVETPIVSHPIKVQENLRECSIALTKLNLNDVVPFCLTHRVHDCFCVGFDLPKREYVRRLPKLPVRYSQSTESPAIVTKPKKPTELPVKSSISTTKLSGYKHSAAFVVKQKKNNLTKNVEEKILEGADETCSRTRQIFPEYVERNKHPHYTRKLKKMYSLTILSPSENSDLDVIDINRSPERYEEKRMNKRKQCFEVRQDLDCDKEPAIQRRKKARPNGSLVTITSPSPAQCECVFDGEIQVPLRDNMDILKIIGEKNAHLDFFRILPWTKLVDGFNTGTIHIWSMMGRPTALLCNKRGTTPPKNFVDIRKVNPRSEIINWIINNTLPPGRIPSLMYVILTPTKNHFLIMGFCLKNLVCNDITPMTPSVRPVEAINSQPSPLLIPPDRSLTCSHKDMNNEPKTLILTNKTFQKRAYNEKNEDVEPRPVFHASLPRIARSCKWRMIYLNSDFSFLCFVESKYSIKYTDLSDVVNMAKSMQRSISLRNTQFTKHYKHSMFGIFCVPEFQDRLFIGPFFKAEDHNIETLRYMQGALINTTCFNTIQKKNYVKKPTWVKESEITISNDSSPEILIDITQDEEDGGETADDNQKSTDTKLEKEPLPEKKLDDSNDSIIILNEPADVASMENEEIQDADGLDDNLLCYPFVKELHSGEIEIDKTNRYIVTNIPHLGYLSAYQQESKVIDVFWPDNNKGYRFPNTCIATEALIQFFSQIFCPVPENFKINVVILTQLHVEKNCPIDPKYFDKSKCYICGEFGVYSEDDCPVSMPSFRSLLRLRQRSDENIDKIVHLFGSYLMTAEERKKNPSTEDILKWAASEIYVVKRLGAHYESERRDLMYLTKQKLLRLKEILKTFPLNERRKYLQNIIDIKNNYKRRRELTVTVATLENIQNLKKTETVKQSSDQNQTAAAPPVMETIEIQDSDDEKDDETSKKFVSKTIFRPVLTSGHIQVAGDERSLLKRNFKPSPGQSLLKVTEDPQFKLMQKNSEVPIKISFGNSRNVTVSSKKMVLSQNQSLIKNVLSQ